MKALKKTIYEYGIIAFGALLLAIGLNGFLVPYKLSVGGVSSLGTLFLYLFSVPLSVTNIFFNAVLFVFGYKFLGKDAVIKTAAGVAFTSVTLELTKNFHVNGCDSFSAGVAGGFLLGAGVGLAIRMGASTGGSDFAAMMLNSRIPHISVSDFIVIIDAAVILLSGIVFRSVLVTVYSVISLFVAARVTDRIITAGALAKSVYIASERVEEISEIIMKTLNRGVTGIYSKGMYSGKKRLMLLCIVSPKELPKLIFAVKSIDKKAFVIIEDAKEVLGEGFVKL